jgi:hypothetical protein
MLRRQEIQKKETQRASTGAEEKDEKSPFFRLYKSTCQKIETAIEKISISVEASSAPPTNHVPTIAMTMKMVKKYGVEEETASNVYSQLTYCEARF